MKEITITYDVFVLADDGAKEYGEAAFRMLIDAELAERLAAGRKCGVALQTIARILLNVERLRGRHFAGIETIKSIKI